MIYLIITTSINNRYGIQDAKERQERYLTSISETLKKLPQQIMPIIVENNGMRSTYLDKFYHQNKPVKVIYTNNNKLNFKSKGINELLDIKEVIKRENINDNDFIIKLTGRYKVTSSQFFNDIIENENIYDAFVKFEQYDCILGCYAMRSNFIKLFNHLSIDNYKSAEIAFARYVRFCGSRLKEIDNLNVECSFSDDLKILYV